MGVTYGDVLPKDAINFMKNKKPTPSFNADNVWREEHATAFSITNMANSSLIKFMQNEAVRALSEGKTYRQFSKAVEHTLVKAGWWGNHKVVNPDTGKTDITRMGSPARIKLIYDSNVRSARAAGAWRRVQKSKKAVPYLLYRLGSSERHRPEHVLLDGTLLPVDDPFWDTHYPPNGYNCKCIAIGTTKFRAKKLGGVTDRPKIKYKEYINKNTGVRSMVPTDIDPGWDYNIGKAARATSPLPPTNNNSKISPRPEPKRKSSKIGNVKNIKDLEKYATNKDLADNAKFNGMDLDIAKRTVSQLESLLTKFPAIRIKLKNFGYWKDLRKDLINKSFEKKKELLKKFGVNDDSRAMRMAKKEIGNGGGIAFYRLDPIESGIFFSEKYYNKNKKEMFLNAIESGRKSGWFQKDDGTPESLLTHEFGHALDDTLKISRTIKSFETLYKKHYSDTYDEFKVKLSGYGRKTRQEFFAEAFGEYIHAKNPREIAKEVGAIVEEQYKKLFGE